MNNTIFDVIDALYVALKPLNIKTYKEVKPETEKGKCITLSHVTIKKTNVNSINDIILFIYTPKINNLVDSLSIKNTCLSVSSILKNFIATNGVIFFNEEREPETDNLDSNYSVTRYIFRTINS